MPQKAIGPNFANELAAAGLGGLPLSWSADGTILYGDAVTPGQREAVAAIYAAHDPAKPDPMAAATQLLAAGLTVTSAGTPDLTGTYGCSTQDEINITGLQAAVAANAFIGWYRDITGKKHTMTGVQFTAIATAVLNFVAAVEEAKAAALAGGAWVAPQAAAEIA